MSRLLGLAVLIVLIAGSNARAGARVFLQIGPPAPVAVLAPVLPPAPYRIRLAARLLRMGWRRVSVGTGCVGAASVCPGGLGVPALGVRAAWLVFRARLLAPDNIRVPLSACSRRAGSGSVRLIWPSCRSAPTGREARPVGHSRRPIQSFALNNASIVCQCRSAAAAS